jgi:tetratricopeptide (TPR) repeat protein
MKRQIVPLLATAVLLGFCGVQARALDTITRKNSERPIAGEITGTSKTEITIKSGLRKTEQKVPANSIDRIRFDKEPPKLNLGRNHEAAGRYAQALEDYHEALEGNPSTFLKTDLEFMIARATARMALAGPSKLDEAVKVLDGFLKAHSDSFRYYPALSLLGEVYLAQDDFASAQAAFGKLEQAPWNETKMAAKTASARLLLKQNKIAEARAAFEAVIALPAGTPAENVRRYVAMLGKAVCLQRENQHQQAVKELEEITNKAPVNESRLQAEAYVRQGDSYRLLRQTKAAILAYLHVDLLFSKESALHAESLFWLSQLQTAAGHPDRADEASAKLELRYPNSQWAKKLASGG